MRPNHTRPQLRHARHLRQLHQHGQRGMALIESLVSILIFSFGVLGLIGLEASAINFSADAEDRNRAALLANEVATSMWLNNSVTVPATQLTTFQTRAADPIQGGVPSGQLTVTAVAARTADIAITWKEHTDAAGAQNRLFSTRVILP